MSEDAGRLVGGRYRLGDVLGRGGMGTVWRGEDEILGRSVAVKELRFPSSVEEDEKQRLITRTLREAKAIARIRSGSAVTVFDVVDEDDRPWIVMELIEGSSLADHIRRDGPLTPQRAAEVGLAVLDVLRAAHREGVLHRDVKPSNVLLEDVTDRVVLTDFGIAKVEGDPSVTSTGMLVGAPSYISPERARGKPPGPPADLWSLGALLYAAVEGRPPYDKGSAISTLTAVMTEPVPPPKQAGELEEVIFGLLTKDPEKRLDVAGARDLLQPVAAGSGAASAAADRSGGGSTAVLPAAPDGAGKDGEADETSKPEGGEPGGGKESGTDAPRAGRDAKGAGRKNSDKKKSDKRRGAKSPAVAGAAAGAAGAAAGAGTASGEPSASPSAGVGESDSAGGEATGGAKAAPAASGAGAAPPSGGTTTFAALANRYPRRTWGIAAAAVAAVLALVAVLFVNAGDGGEGGKSGKDAAASGGSGEGAKGEKGTGDKKDGKDEGGEESAPSPAPEESSGEGGDDEEPGDEGGSLPDDYEQVTNKRFHFSIAMPKDFERVGIAGTNSGAKYSGGGLPKLQVDFSGSPKSDAAATWRALEPAVSNSSGYKLRGIKKVDWRDYPSVADWQFERDEDGKRVRVLNRGFKADSSHGFAIMITCRADKWDDEECRTLRETAFETFKPLD